MGDAKRVLLDARLAIRGLGIATYIERLISGFAETSGPQPKIWRGLGEWGSLGIASTLTRSGLFDISPKLDPRTRTYEVVHFASNTGSLHPGRNSVLTVYDLMHRRRKSTRGRIIGKLLETSLQRAGRVVAVSGRTRDEIEQAFPQLSGKVEVIPPGQRRIQHLYSSREHILAFAGAGDPRKRTDLVVQIYREYQASAADALPLVVLARAGLTPVQRSELIGLGAVIVESASRHEVDNLLGRAAALLFPTIEEGLGFPILEAAEFGTPVVIDAGAKMADEVLGAHCVRVDEASLTAWVAGLRWAVSLGPVEGTLQLPDWSAVARAYQSIYEQVSPG